ncbi:cofilin, variant 2 [Orbilia ellipsospora]|uniref:Cofilin n=1 Tax=Orbilia ellipsospora TaxID=2528407 RepID=A0AAV9WXM6_9PEZI
MSRSGVAVAPDCITAFEDLKLKKTHKYIIYKLSANKTTIEIDKSGSEEDYDAFLTQLPENDCRYAIYDFAYKTDEGAPRNKICFYAWSPDDAPIRSKMVSSSSKDALRRALNGVAIEIQGTDFAEVSHETVEEKCKKGR